MSSSDKALQAKFKKILDELLKEPENKVCADCKTRSPRWASSTLGVFICIRCSGIHRNLGVHISFVRSVNLDSWTGKEVRMMQKWGNRKANMYWECKFNNESIRPNEQSTMQEAEKFIRMKYEQQKWVDPNFDLTKLDSSSSHKSTTTTTTNTTTSNNTTSTNNSNNKNENSNIKKSHSRHASSHKNEINNNNNSNNNIIDFGTTNDNTTVVTTATTTQYRGRRKSIEEIREKAVKIPDNEEDININKNKHKTNKESNKQNKPRVDSIHSLKDNIVISSNGIPDDFWDDKPQTNNNNNNAKSNSTNNITNNELDLFSNMDISNNNSNNNSNKQLNNINSSNDDLMNLDFIDMKPHAIDSKDIDELFNVSATSINSPIINSNSSNNKLFSSSNGMDNIDVYMNMNINPLHKPRATSQSQQRAVAMNRMMGMMPQSPSQMGNMMGGMGMMGGTGTVYNVPPPMNLGGTGMMNQGMMNMGMPSNVIGGNLSVGSSPTNNAFHNRRQQNKIPPKYY